VSLDTARLLFDECLGRPAIERLVDLIEMGKGEKPVVRHVLEFAPPGTHDEIWIPKLATEHWTVITADSGRQPNRNRGEKLPRLCARLGVTHVMLSPIVHNRTSFEKLLTILHVWYDLLQIACSTQERGNRYFLEPTPKLERGRGRLVPRTIPADLIVLRDDYLKSQAQALTSPVGQAAALPEGPAEIDDPHTQAHISAGSASTDSVTADTGANSAPQKVASAPSS
jgi:hypothetical protein